MYTFSEIFLDSCQIKKIRTSTLVKDFKTSLALFNKNNMVHIGNAHTYLNLYKRKYKILLFYFCTVVK